MIERFDERRGWSPIPCRAVLVLLGCFLIAATALHAQGRSRADSTRIDSTRTLRNDAPRTDSLHTDSLHADTLHADSLRNADTAAADSTRGRFPGGTRLLLRDVGAPLGSVTDVDEHAGYNFAGKRELVWGRYFTAFDALAWHLPAVPVSTGVPGEVRAFSYGEASASSISALYNGRPLWGALGRAYDLELYPMEFLERAEVLRGARAAVFGSGESLVAINFVEPRYDAEGSYTRIWYAEGPSNTSDADITYARNVGSRANLSLGFRRLASDGIYANQKVSNWVGRGAMRWDISDKLVASVTEIYSESTRGLNGGLTDSSSISSFAAELFNDSLSEHELRHDLTFAARWYPIGRAHLPGDSAVGEGLDTTFRIDGSLYYSYAERSLMVGDSIARIAGVSSRELANIVGARAGLTLPLVFARFLGNGVLEYGDNGRLRLEAGGLLEIPAGNVLTLRGGLKVHGYGDDLFLTAVGEGVIGIGDSISLRGTLRNTTQILPATTCPPVPLDPLDSVRALSANRTGIFGEAELLLHNGRLQLDLGAYLRHAPENDCSGFDSYIVAGGDATVRIPIGFLTLENHLLVSIPSSDFRAFPLIYGEGDLHGEWSLFEGNLNLRLGTTLEYESSHPLMRYDYVGGELLATRDTGSVGKIPYPVWGAYAQARIGSAFLRIEMRNILDVDFETLERYPTFGRAIYLGVNWALID